MTGKRAAEHLEENLVAEQKLTVPKEEMPLCVWGVKA